MKCSACENNECERKYANRHRCVGDKEEIDCTCTCQESAADEIAKSGFSVSAGIASVAGGVALTMMTGGVFAVVAGASLIGAGSSLIMNPVQKKITGERMTLKDTAQDIALGGTIGDLFFPLLCSLEQRIIAGAITGPIGAAGSLVSIGASGAAKLGIRSGIGATAGLNIQLE